MKSKVKKLFRKRNSSQVIEENKFKLTTLAGGAATESFAGMPENYDFLWNSDQDDSSCLRDSSKFQDNFAGFSIMKVLRKKSSQEESSEEKMVQRYQVLEAQVPRRVVEVCRAVSSRQRHHLSWKLTSRNLDREPSRRESVRESWLVGTGGNLVSRRLCWKAVSQRPRRLKRYVVPILHISLFLTWQLLAQRFTAWSDKSCFDKEKTSIVAVVVVSCGGDWKGGHRGRKNACQLFTWSHYSIERIESSS
jgi:hypothetical protein